MASGKSEVSIATNPDNVWKLIRDFGGVADYMPGIDSCTVDGDVRPTASPISRTDGG